MIDQNWKLAPAEIEARSFAIIDAEAGPHGWDAGSWPLVRRLVHTSADFDYVRDLAVSPGAVEAGVRALMEGADVLTDTNMALSGLNLSRLGGFGNRTLCLIGDPEAARRAREGGLTRAMAAVDLAFERGHGPAGAIWVVGNAPTALMRLMERLAADPALPRPRLVVGLPVGFVNALESKRALAASGLPHVTNLSRKGGSNVAAAAVNALAALARARAEGSAASGGGAPSPPSSAGPGPAGAPEPASAPVPSGPAPEPSEPASAAPGAGARAPRRVPALMIAAPASGQGKTTVTAALARLHRRSGRRVRVFKCGPDFLDPTILEAASGAPVHQLDLWMVGEDGCRDLLWRAAGGADVVLVEAVMGLFDGDPSAADLAAALDLPVLAVVDARAMAQSFGAVALGLAAFRPGLRLAGVLANRVAGDSHAALLKASLPPSLEWLGALRRGGDLELPSRHLGLVMASELPDLDRRLDLAADLLAAAPAGSLPPEAVFRPSPAAPAPRLMEGRVVAVARDEAFAFIYPANLELLRDMGAELAFFSPVAGDGLPDCDSLWLPGGYPELHLAALSANRALAGDITRHHRLGRPILAECGGMLYLLRSLADRGGAPLPMVGLLPGSAVLTGSLKGLGLMAAEFPEGTLRGHAFHHSELTMDAEPALHGVRRDRREERVEPVWRTGGLTASYIHFYLPSNPAAAAALLGGRTA